MSNTDEEWLADYLRLEYGEKETDPDSLKSSDLTFVGEFVVNGVTTRYWSYPTCGDPMWAIIEEYEEGRCAGITDKAPPEC